MIFQLYMVQYFQNTPKPEGDLPPDIKPEMIIWSEDYRNLENSLNKMFDLNINKKSNRKTLK